MTRGSASCRRRATVAPPAPSSSVSDAPGGLVRAIGEVFQGGCSYSFVNWAMLFSRLNRDMLTPGLSADGLQSVRSASTRRRRAPCPA